MTLSQEHLRLLRAATSVSFHHGTLSDGTTAARIRLHREFRLPGPDGDTDFDFVAEIELPSTVRSYRRDAAPERFSCFHYISAASFSRRWRTVVAALRTGDALSLAWVHGNDSDNLRSVGYHADELSLVVERPSRREPSEYLVAYQTGPQNSASMVRPGHPGDTAALRWSRIGPADVLSAAADALDGLPRRRSVTVALAEDATAQMEGYTALTCARGPVSVRWVADASLPEDRVVLLDTRCTRVLDAVWVPPPAVDALGASAVALYRELRDQGHRSSTAADAAAAALQQPART